MVWSYILVRPDQLCDIRTPKKKKVYKKIHIKEKKLQLAPGRRLRMHLSAKERNLPGEPDSEYMPLYLSEMRSFSANQKLKAVRLREHYEVKLIL